ncbi:hypothetical protein PC110_g22220 [Phytophthora cactorum]|uniref:Uncharacterized protein n=4 Tax=Phytophthora cactorum TaxID=29920 RepID=A0A329RBX4_9STRA|nr:hypothetical protein PC111_g22865 [Phytophthora cactorum]KAG2871751.1 hypothetical protein PC114_g26748 [Phytophthora cactorum]RAW20713.1 hypothetical protein PC110_g22844 [Phytophthora cactorum]RAW21336.1 hypothetical protein PC110_g22221 [Phytophthora cactorum]RAW21337.1 hypothetical protein PC110_g22220 [Phytophthora cactorum]
MEMMRSILMTTGSALELALLGSTQMRCVGAGIGGANAWIDGDADGDVGVDGDADMDTDSVDDVAGGAGVGVAAAGVNGKPGVTGMIEAVVGAGVDGGVDAVVDDY